MILHSVSVTKKLPVTRALMTPMKSEEKGVMIIFEGPDNSGKTSVSRAYAELRNIPYYKNPRERAYKLSGEITEMSKYCMIWLADFIQQVPVTAILDRHYPSEWVYSQVEQRAYDEQLLREVDTLFANAHAKIVICIKDSYEGYVDETTHSDSIPQLVEMYKKFAVWSNVKDILLLNTTNENVNEQLARIDYFVRG